ncbi:hypothetical protein B0H16DRAFT_1461688 [Mycena metata]|uniref:Uncharacterized protein n=1 Tax=Mycena metata TaxID=1033252 RepID=A0AAD7ITM8_9AGAR|nr:hypothetical protein B0H16DRAFT_1461688 [Mycena metata]
MVTLSTIILVLLSANLFDDPIYASVVSVTNLDNGSLSPATVPENAYCLFGRVICQQGAGKTTLSLVGDTTIYPSGNANKVDNTILAVYPDSDPGNLTSLVPGPTQANSAAVKAQWSLTQVAYYTDSKLGVSSRFYTICTPDSAPSRCWCGKGGGSQANRPPPNRADDGQAYATDGKEAHQEVATNVPVTDGGASGGTDAETKGTDDTM